MEDEDYRITELKRKIQEEKEKNEEESRKIKEKIDKFKSQTDPPSLITIEGLKDKNLGAILDNFVGNWELKTKNKENYRTKWKEFLPLEVQHYDTKTFETFYNDWSLAFIPRIILRKALLKNFPSGNSNPEKLVNWPYFIVVLNNSRDSRPQQPTRPGDDLLQKNLLDKGMVISEVDNFYLSPNGFPYHNYASLLISKEKRPQGQVTPRDIETWIKFSFLTDQYVFFNSWQAGASRKERFHAQVVDPEVLRFEGKALEYPIRNENLVSRSRIKNGTYQLENYAAEALIFNDKDSPFQASRLTSKLEDHNIPYNILINGKEVYVIGRNAKREVSDCIGKKVGGYECSGVVLVGNIEERVLENAGLDKIVRGNQVFNELDYETAFSNINAASMPINWMKDLL